MSGTNLLKKEKNLLILLKKEKKRYPPDIVMPPLLVYLQQLWPNTLLFRDRIRDRAYIYVCIYTIGSGKGLLGLTHRERERERKKKMGRRKLEMKRIEDKSSRQVTFSKRRSGLFKKSRHLSLLCDVDIAVIVFSARDKLYEFSSGSSTSSSGASNSSVEHILSRYQKSCLEAEERTIKSADKDLEFSLQCNTFRTCKELLQTVDRLVEENNAEELSVADMTQLELELDDALVQTRLRKTQLMMEHISTLQEEQRKLREGKEEMEKQVASAKKQQQQDENDGGGGLNDLATNQMNSPQLFTTLLLFDG